MTTYPVISCRLEGHGRLEWPELRDRLSGFRAAWGDLDGMHLNELLPDQPPAFTHLWAWAAAGCARVRVDLHSGRHVLGVLVPEGCSGLDVSPVTSELLGARVMPALGWGQDARVRLAARLREPCLERLVTIDLAPVTFVRSSDQA